ncbi:MAG: RluA family pseudouridine synthase [Rhodothermales bacterium]
MSTEPDKQETVISLTVPEGYRESERLDQYVTGFVANSSRNKVKQAVKAGQVTVNGRVVKRPSHAMQAGDVIECRVMRPPPLQVIPQDIPLDICYEDDVLLVVNKPAGMVVHPAYGNRDGTLVNALLYHVGGRVLDLEGDADELDDDEVGLSVVNAAPRFENDAVIRPGIVHRLDKDTSGVMVVAKTDVAHTHLAKQFMARTIHRRYRALVWGMPSPMKGSIETWLARDRRDRKKVAVSEEGTGKHALTYYQQLDGFGHTALLEFRLATGRTHQIRVHAQHIGHPIFGDVTYGGQQIRYGLRTGPRRAFYQQLFQMLPRQALHAFSLGFIHPETGEELYFEAPLPEDMQMVLDALKTGREDPNVLR